MDKSFDQKVQASLFLVAQDLSNFNKTQMPNDNPVEQISYNYYVVDVNCIIEPSILEHYLKGRLSQNNIDLDYEYAIYDCYTDQMVYGNYIHSDDGSPKKPTAEFEKVDDYVYYFGVSFPTKTMYLVSGQYVWFLSGLVLISALAFFAYATYELLRQKRLSEVQKEFIDNMTHEFKTPISTIGISSKVLTEPNISDDPERLQRYARIIMNQNKRLEEKIEQILQVASLEKSTIKMNFQVVPLKELIHDITENFKVKLNEKEGQLRFTAVDGDLKILADSFHLSNAIFNLLDNAIKYCDKKPDIQIGLKDELNNAIISVKDNGIGIEEKYTKKIFNKFFRIPTGDIHNVKGFGIGLNYVQKIVKIHGGTIYLESKSGEGSNFVITIPKNLS